MGTTNPPFFLPLQFNLHLPDEQREDYHYTTPDSFIAAQHERVVGVPRFGADVCKEGYCYFL